MKCSKYFNKTLLGEQDFSKISIFMKFEVLFKYGCADYETMENRAADRSSFGPLIRLKEIG